MKDTECLVVFADCDGMIVSLNSVCERVTGYAADELIGKPLVEQLVPPNWRNLVRTRFGATAAFDVRNPHCNPWITKDGKERMIEWSCSFVPGENGPLIMGRGQVCEDMSEVCWDDVRMISFDGNKISLVVDGEATPKVFEFGSHAEMEEQLRRWFGVQG
jgi:PAS domain S-box-containing protein